MAAKLLGIAGGSLIRLTVKANTRRPELRGAGTVTPSWALLLVPHALPGVVPAFQDPHPYGVGGGLGYPGAAKPSGDQLSSPEAEMKEMEKHFDNLYKSQEANRSTHAAIAEVSPGQVQDAISDLRLHFRVLAGCSVEALWRSSGACQAELFLPGMLLWRFMLAGWARAQEQYDCAEFLNHMVPMLCPQALAGDRLEGAGDWHV